SLEMLSRKLEEFGTFKCFHLMYQAWGDVHAIARGHFELLESIAINRIFDANLQASFVQIERLRFQLVIVQRATLAFADFQYFSAIEPIVGNPDFPTPTLRLDMYRFSRSGDRCVFSDRAHS